MFIAVDVEGEVHPPAPGDDTDEHAEHEPGDTGDGDRHGEMPRASRVASVGDVDVSPAVHGAPGCVHEPAGPHEHVAVADAISLPAPVSVAA